VKDRFEPVTIRIGDAFAIGRFADAEWTEDGLKLRALGPVGADVNSALANTAPIYRFLKARMGMALPLSEYLQVFVSGDAAQEAAGMALLSAAVLDDVRKDPTDDWVFSHELSHQWFGWQVPCADFSDFWLNEGFATFFVLRSKSSAGAAERTNASSGARAAQASERARRIAVLGGNTTLRARTIGKGRANRRFARSSGSREWSRPETFFFQMGLFGRTGPLISSALRYQCCAMHT
jgi:aminopeptidase N